MPIYEYRCEACGHTLDALQKISDAPLTRCEACGADTLRRLVSAPAFRLKGGGWYETDFKSDKEKKRNLAGDGKDSKAASGSDGGAAADKGAKEGGKKAVKESAGASPSKPSPSPEPA